MDDLFLNRRQGSLIIKAKDISSRKPNTKEREPREVIKRSEERNLEQKRSLSHVFMRNLVF